MRSKWYINKRTREVHIRDQLYAGVEAGAAKSTDWVCRSRFGRSSCGQDPDNPHLLSFLIATRYPGHSSNEAATWDPVRPEVHLGQQYTGAGRWRSGLFWRHAPVCDDLVLSPLSPSLAGRALSAVSVDRCGARQICGRPCWARNAHNWSVSHRSVPPMPTGAHRHPQAPTDVHRCPQAPRHPDTHKSPTVAIWKRRGCLHRPVDGQGQQASKPCLALLAGHRSAAGLPSTPGSRCLPLDTRCTLAYSTAFPLTTPWRKVHKREAEAKAEAKCEALAAGGVSLWPVV